MSLRSYLHGEAPPSWETGLILIWITVVAATYVALWLVGLVVG